jgi:hypothetical protein
MKPLARQRSGCTIDGHVGGQRRSGQNLVHGDQHQVSQGRQNRQRQGREMPLRRRPKRLGGDLQADKDQDRKGGRLGQPLEQVREPAQQAGGADEHRRGQRVGGAAAHGLVGGLADVGRVLDHAPARPGRHRGQPFGQENGARVVLIAGRRRAFGAVDAADDRGQGKRQHHRQTGQGLQSHALPPEQVP